MTLQKNNGAFINVLHIFIANTAKFSYFYSNTQLNSYIFIANKAKFSHF